MPAPEGSLPPSGPPLRHRGDIDGLRAIAILSVLLVHCGVTALRGGFIGVDVFFVISGYLITLISEREIAAGRFTVAAFYRRRALRILPALAAMVAVVLVMGCLVLFPHRLRDLGMSAAATDTGSWQAFSICWSALASRSTPHWR